ncbi:MAG: hypothetical protein CL534_11825 [Ahrensia sp.]|nr:hypothetical protein [Ahrensia sp.]
MRGQLRESFILFNSRTIHIMWLSFGLSIFANQTWSNCTNFTQIMLHISQRVHHIVDLINYVCIRDRNVVALQQFRKSVECLFCTAEISPILGLGDAHTYTVDILPPRKNVMPNFGVGSVVYQHKVDIF